VKTPPSKDAFAKLLMDRIRQTGEKGNIVYELKEFCLRGEGNKFAVFLTNAYTEYCAAEENRGKVLKLWVRNWFGASKEMPEDFEDVKSDLLPVVRSRSHFVEVADWPYEILGEHFGIGIVYDLPESMRSIPQASFDAWGVTFYEALEAAMENLLSLEAKFISTEGAYLSATGDNYDASRLLLKDAIRHFQVKGDPIAMIPNRENLIVSGSEDVEGLAGMVNLAKKALKEPRPISGIALRLDGDEWKSWLPPPSHPSYTAFQQLRLKALEQDYAKQTKLLDKVNMKNGEDVLVASFDWVRSPNRRVFSCATWTEAKDSLLPKTEVVMFLRIAGKPVMAEWEKVVNAAGDLMETVDIYPPRFRVRSFPSEDQLAAMGNMLK